MRRLIKQRVFSWTDTYDIYDEWGEPLYFVKAKAFRLGHQIYLYDGQERLLASVHQKLFRLLPEFELIVAGESMGSIHKELTLFHPSYTLDCNGWQVEGDFFAWDYDVTAPNGEVVLHISKELFQWGDTYVLEIPDAKNELLCLLIAIAIDAANCGD